jgi:hypothetical protein
MTFEPPAHSIVGASSAKRWMTCAGSVHLSEQVPKEDDDGGSVYAREGTAAHELAEDCLKLGMNAADCIGDEYNGFTVDDEMAAHVQVYLDLVREKMKDGYQLFVESKVDLSWIDERMFGTNDAMLVKPYNDAIIFDLKYGKGVRVTAENNPQLAFYALGPFRSYDLKKIEAYIVQPRVMDGVTSTVWSKEDMDNWERDFTQAVKATRLPNAPLVQGDHCRWCPALGVCPAQLDDFNDLDATRDVSVLTNEQIGEVLAKADLIRSFLDAVAIQALNRAAEGNPPPGYKLVAGRKGNRKWINGVEGMFPVDTFPDLYETKLLSPAKVFKLRPDLADDTLVEQSPAKPTLAPEDDPRNALTTVADLDFD